MKAKKVVLAGASGYLGGYILEELMVRNTPNIIVVSKPKKLEFIYISN